MADSSSDDDMLRVLQIQTIAVAMQMRRKKKPQRRLYMRSIFAQRKEHGDYHQLVRELELGDSEYYLRYLRMTPDLLEDILRRVGPLLQHGDNHRIPIAVKERLVMALRYCNIYHKQNEFQKYRVTKCFICLLYPCLSTVSVNIQLIYN